MPIKIKLSVHQLVDFLLRKGDIDTRIYSSNTMQEGSRIHAFYQSKQGINYLSEYLLKTNIVYKDYEFELEGRADGIIQNGNSFSVDEIKSSIAPLVDFRKEQIDWHLGQAKCYAYMFMKERNLENIGVKLTYISQINTKDKLIETYHFDFKEIESYIFSLLDEYISFYQIISRKEKTRNETIEKLPFPFQTYRKGQRELAKYSYSIAKNGGKLFVEAPTGIGKTISTLYPFIKTLDQNRDGKIFYLTAKASGKEAAHNAIEILKGKGLSIFDIVIYAKDKICFSKGKACNPEECPFAKGYYNKIQKIIKDSLLNYSDFTYDRIVDIAMKNEVCPFELELDLSLFSDVIICDYNYMFDPLVYMKRYFDADTSHFLALIDEAHNLVDRSKDMYSASLSTATFFEAKKSIKKLEHKKIKSAFRKLNKIFSEVKKTFPNKETLVDFFDDNFFRILSNTSLAIQDISKNDSKSMNKELLDLLLEINKFIKISDFYSDKFISYIDIEGNRKKTVTFNIKCLDASTFLAKRLNQIKGSILFSASLSPLEYYIKLLGGSIEKDASLTLKSPFEKNKLLFLIDPKISIKYSKRSDSYEEVAKSIKAFISQKIGNYLVYVPSYEYQENLLKILDLDSRIKLLVQSKEMDEQEKQEFISEFTNNPVITTLGIAILGGSFAEGIDLVQDRLIGAVIIGVGLPKINFVSDQIAKHYDGLGYNGKDYAYIYPGMNKVMQAIGRVIRSEKDEGAVLLIDERYTLNQYQDLFKKEWDNYKIVLSYSDINEEVKKFFKKKSVIK
jgi:DNA excision repair protein ERCC-2